MTACHRATNIPELLELIASHLDWRTLLVSQRVSRSWQYLIKHSPRLQSDLGFLGKQNQEHWAFRVNALGHITSGRPIRSADDTVQLGKEIVLRRASPTPCMDLLPSGSVSDRLGRGYSTEFFLHYNSIPSSWLLSNWATASWRQMQCFQPPVTRLEACTVLYFRDNLMFRRMPGHRFVVELANDTGITLGDLVELIVEWRIEAPPDINWDIELFSLTAVGVLILDTFFKTLKRTPEQSLA